MKCDPFLQGKGSVNIETETIAPGGVPPEPTGADIPRPVIPKDTEAPEVVGEILGSVGDKEDTEKVETEPERQDVELKEEVRGDTDVVLDEKRDEEEAECDKDPEPTPVPAKKDTGVKEAARPLKRVRRKVVYYYEDSEPSRKGSEVSESGSDSESEESEDSGSDETPPKRKSGKRVRFSKEPQELEPVRVENLSKSASFKYF